MLGWDSPRSLAERLKDMGITYVTGKVSSGKGREAELEFLVDSGTNYTVLPKSVWKKLKLKPKRVAQFVLADGTKIERHIGECLIQLDLGECHTPVVLGAGASISGVAEVARLRI